MPKVPSGNAFLNPEQILKKIGLNVGKTVADLGCGSAGYFVLQAAKMVGVKSTVYAVDVLKTALDSVESKAKMEGFTNIKTIWSNLEIYQATKIEDNSLDFAFLFNTLFQTKKHEAMFKEAARMIKPGGKLAVVEWSQTWAPFGPVPEDRLPEEKIKKLAAAAGLKEESAFEAGVYHYGIVFVK